MTEAQSRLGSPLASAHVLVTDLDSNFLDGSTFSNLEVRRRNIVTDPLPDGAFDLIHARLVLVHIPEREKVLARLVAALKPGGWIIEEEFDSQSLHCDPLLMSGEVHLKAQTALFRLLDERGVERRWGRLVYGRMRALGLVDVRAEARLSMWHAGSVGTSFDPRELRTASRCADCRRIRYQGRIGARHCKARQSRFHNAIADHVDHMGEKTDSRLSQ